MMEALKGQKGCVCRSVFVFCLLKLAPFRERLNNWTNCVNPIEHSWTMLSHVYPPTRPEFALRRTKTHHSRKRQTLGFFANVQAHVCLPKLVWHTMQGPEYVIANRLSVCGPLKHPDVNSTWQLWPSSLPQSGWDGTKEMHLPRFPQGKSLTY